MTYKVSLMQGNTYEVWKIYLSDDDREDEKVFQGTLSDCEAWIRLTEQGYM